MAADDRREQAIGLAIGQIEKQFGKGSIMRLGADAVLPDIKVIPTGSLSLDLALGVGGVPRGRIIEIYGPESSGKTTLALHVLAEAQKMVDVFLPSVNMKHRMNVEAEPAQVVEAPVVEAPTEAPVEQPAVEAPVEAPVAEAPVEEAPAENPDAAAVG